MVNKVRKELIIRLYEENFGTHKEITIEVNRLMPKSLTSLNTIKNIMWRHENIEHNKKYKREYARKYRNIDENRKRLNDRSREWNIRNPSYIREYKRTYNMNINNRIIHNLRSRLWQVLKGVNKSTSTMKLIGCSIEELKDHLESTWIEGMTWDNYGDWHVDHIKPCVLFDFTDAEQQYKCFHWTNLQALWAFDNKSKNAKTIVPLLIRGV